jgi:hypothetical protein
MTGILVLCSLKMESAFPGIASLHWEFVSCNFGEWWRSRAVRHDAISRGPLSLGVPLVHAAQGGFSYTSRTCRPGWVWLYLSCMWAVRIGHAFVCVHAWQCSHAHKNMYMHIYIYIYIYIYLFWLKQKSGAQGHTCAPWLVSLICQILTYLGFQAAPPPLAPRCHGNPVVFTALVN